MGRQQGHAHRSQGRALPSPGLSGHLFSSSGAPWDHRCLFCSDSVLGADPRGYSSRWSCCWLWPPAQPGALVNSSPKVTCARLDLGARSFKSSAQPEIPLACSGTKILKYERGPFPSFCVSWSQKSWRCIRWGASRTEKPPKTVDHEPLWVRWGGLWWLTGLSHGKESTGCTTWSRRVWKDVLRSWPSLALHLQLWDPARGSVSVLPEKPVYSLTSIGYTQIYSCIGYMCLL